LAWFDDNSQFPFGKHKGKKVLEVTDSGYVKWLHESKYNIYFTEEVFKRLGITHGGLTKYGK